jgi:HNH endonuclease
MSAPCSIRDCDKPYYAKGFCNMHWQRMKKNGNPLEVPLRKMADPSARFWSRVDKRGKNDCWLFKGASTNAGYGRFQPGRAKTKHWSAHRYAFYLATGETPPVVMHTCDVRMCCNPAHLKAGTHKDNMRDMVAKGRNSKTGAFGDRNFNTKLTPDDVRAIRLRTSESANKVSKDYGVNHRTILAIWRGITWRDIE